MTTAVMTEPLASPSPMLKARAAGFLWLMTFVLGMYALTGDRLIVWKDAAATAANIAAHESQFRLGVVANLIAAITYLAATVLVYELLEPVNRSVSLTAAFFSLAGCAVSGVSFVFRLTPLAATGQETLAMTLLRVGSQAFNIAHVFFGLHCLLVGALIVKSRFLPRIVGALMVFAGLGWLTMSFSNLLAPAFGRALTPWIFLPGMLGEGTLLLWLLFAGVNVEQWMRRAR